MDLGDFRLYSLNDGVFRLDGGAIFGVVPKTLWEKKARPDDLNRVPLGLNPLLIRTGTDNILVDTGIGGKGDEKFRSVYAIERASTLTGSLAAIGLRPEEITVVINTHLHFDHAGGNTFVDAGGQIRPVFSKARHIVQRGEWEAANAPNERTQASYRQEDFLPVMKDGLFELVEGDSEVVKGVSVFRTSGHNRDIQLVRVTSGGETAVYLSDIVPTVAHLEYPYIMGYDLFPLETLKAKKEILVRAAKERWLLVFVHDPASTMGFVRIKESGPVFEKVS